MVRYSAIPEGRAHNAQRSLTVLIFLSAFALGGGVSFVYLWLSPRVALGVLICVGALGAVGYALMRGRSVFDSPTYLTLVSYAVFFGLGALSVPFMPRLLKPVEDLSPLLVALAGLAALLIGAYLSRVLFPHRIFAIKVRGGQSISFRRLRLLGLLFCAVGMMGVLLYLSSVGGIQFLLESIYGIREDLGLYYFLIVLLRSGFYILLAWMIAMRPRSRMWAFFMLFVGVFNLFWFGPLRGSRHQVLTFLLATIILTRRLGLGGRLGFGIKAMLIVGLAAVFLTISVWGNLRQYSLQEIASLDRATIFDVSGMQGAVVQAIYEPYDTYSRIVTGVPLVMPELRGYTFWESLVIVVPRALWPSKPLSRGDWLEWTIYGEMGGNTVPTWPGELYLNFGLSGVVVGMWFTGIFCWLISNLGRVPGATKQISVARVLMYSVTYPSFLELIWGGSNALMWYLYGDVLPVYVALWLCRKRGAAFVSGA